MKLNEYKSGDNVEALTFNPQLNKDVWVDAEVLDKRMVHQKHGKPYPILIVRLKRTYCKATPQYRWFDNIPFFVDNLLQFYEKETDEGFIQDEQIRLKTA